MEDFKMILTAGLVPFPESRIIYVGENSSHLNIIEDMNVEMRRLDYATSLIRLGVDIDSEEGIRLIGKKL